MRRMDRYQETLITPKRAEKNKVLYEDVSTNPRYANITDVANINAYELSRTNNEATTRESYQQMRRYKNMNTPTKSKKDLDNFNYLYPKQEKKIYDINSVLEEARKNRKEQDELEEKRKLKYTSYNILAGVNLEELMKYREEKKNRDITPEEEGIRELIDTIASKTLAGELDKETTVDLLSDLMATSVLDKVAPQKEEGADEIGINDLLEVSTMNSQMNGFDDGQEDDALEENIQFSQDNNNEYSQNENLITVEEGSISENIVTQEGLSLPVVAEDKAPISTNEENSNQILQEQIKESAINVENTTENKIDTEFYTKSMDLSEEDFEMADDFKEKSLPLPLKIFLIILFIAIVAITAFFVYQKIK